MRYRIANIALGIDEDDSVLSARAADRLGLSVSALSEIVVVRRSLDARKKGRPRWLLQAEVTTGERVRSAIEGVTPVLAACPTPSPTNLSAPPPVIVGAGPAGLFCAFSLLERGITSIVVDRGKPVLRRGNDVARLFDSGHLDPESNMYFGEGGAGAYTDGKLATRIHDPSVRRVFELFARYGRVPHILVEGKPHVGSDLLPAAVAALRAELEKNGCRFLWDARVTDIEVLSGHVRGVKLANGDAVDSNRVVLAPGNSARELFELFALRNWPIEAKPFAAGFRVEHPQSLVDRIQYGSAAGHPRLPPADYRLAENLNVGGNTRGIFSFCMCPGGVLVPTPTELEMLCTNGMSNSDRSSPYANAGLVVAVSPADLSSEGFGGPLAGLEWQRKWERAAYRLGGGGYRAPAQRITDYLSGRPANTLPSSSYRPGLDPGDLRSLFPSWLSDTFREGVRRFDRTMRGFLTSEALLVGIESRTSSPCRIVRGDDYQSPAIRGLYPAGEGAGYAGGITSSAVDGLRVAAAICREIETA